MNGLAYNFPAQVAWKTLNLLVERKGLLYPTGTAFYVWQRSNRVIVAFDPSAIQLERVNEDFAHALSTRLHGRRVIRTNSRGIFLQVGFDIPAAPMALEAIPLDLTKQETPWHVPVGMTKDGPLWISLLEGDSFLVGGSRGGGKTGEEHGWIQSLLHGGKTLIYAWDGKRGAEFGRYIGHPHFHMLFGSSGLEQLQSMLRERETELQQSGYPNIQMYNEAHPDAFIRPVALFVDEAADLPDRAKDLLKQMIRLYRHTGLFPIIATNQPTVADVFNKTNLSTRVAFRVPHHNDSVTMLGYKGAEALPDMRGRGLIVWKGRFVEFQSFTVTYPMPLPTATRILSEMESQGTTKAEAVEPDPDVVKIRELIEQGESDAAIVRKVWNVAGGAKFYKLVERVKSLRDTSSSTSSSLPGPVLGLEGAV